MSLSISIRALNFARQAENLALLQRFGFAPSEVHTVLGIRNWFMLRPARQ